ncbi:MAG TPA: hypothetical protein V6D12_11605 [Candidatus Obscuribacterales bacterium]
MSYPILEQAAKAFTTNPPAPEKVVSELLEAEKKAKHSKERYFFHQLIGTWRLCFITGTKKTRARAGIVLGAGRYVPKFIKIKIFYANTTPEQDIDAGTVENCVEFGGLRIALTGITKFLPKKNILAFDFTRMNIQLFGATLYKGYIRGGERKEQEFYQESVSKQAFFSYFLVQDEMIAARGRGGGLALWRREE